MIVLAYNFQNDHSIIYAVNYAVTVTVNHSINYEPKYLTALIM